MKTEGMLSENDKEVANRIIEFIGQYENTDETTVDWEKVEWQSVIHKMMDNLQKAPLSYREASEDDVKSNYYTAECDCGWWGSSRLLNGGGSIADTGDYDDCRCPVCESPEIEEKHQAEPKDERSV